MGAGESKVPIIAPWEVHDGEKPYPDATVSRIKAIADSASSFLQPPSGASAADLADFSLEDCMARVEGAVLHEPKISQWMPKLVPKRVSEDHFWRNYFLHVKMIVREVDPSFVLLPPGASGTGPTHKTIASDTQAKAGSDGGSKGATGSNGTSASSGVQQQNSAPRPVRKRTDAEIPPERKLPNGSQPAHTPTLSKPGAGLRPAAPGIDYPGPTTEHEQEEEAIRQDYSLHHEEQLQYDESALRGPIRWGLIGCGKVCEIKSGPAFYKAPGSQLVAVCCRTEAKARDFAQRHNVPKSYTKAESLIWDQDVDAVYIATPPGSHFDLALKVCAAGKPCYVEKPMARHHEECRVMVDQFFRHNLPLYVGFYRRRLDRFVAARQIIARFLGDVSSVSVVLSRSDHLPRPSADGALQYRDLGWRAQPEQSGGGLFLDLGSHTLDILDFLVGPLGHLTGDATTHPAVAADVTVETLVSMTFRTASGALGTAVWDFCSGTYQDVLTVRGTKGTLTMSIFGKDGPVLHLPNGKYVQYSHVYPEHVHLPLVTSIVQQLRGVNVPEDRLSTGQSAARTALVMDSVLRKFYRSRTDHFWKRQHTWDNQRNMSGTGGALGYSQ